MKTCFDRSSIIIAFLLIVFAIGSGCGKERIVGRCYDFLSHLSDAEIVLNGDRVDSLRFLGPPQPWSEEERTFCPAPPRSSIVFSDVPLGRNGRLVVGYGLRPRLLEIDRAAPNEKVQFTVHLHAEGKEHVLLDQVIELSKLEPGKIIEETIALPETMAKSGSFTFSADGTAKAMNYQPVWCSPVLRSEGRDAIEKESRIPIRKLATLLLETPVDAHADNGLRVDFDEEEKKFVPTPDGRLLMQEVPGSSRFRLSIPKNAHLSFGIASNDTSGQNSMHEVEFEVKVDGKRLFKEKRFSSSRSGTRRISVPIAPTRKEKALIELITRTGSRAPKENPDISAIWIYPIIEKTIEVERRIASKGKNVLLLVVDALRADHLSGYGYERDTSPNLDRYAQSGIRFTNALAQSSWTIPSTASLLTGKYSYTHGLYDTFHWFLVPGITTVTQHFLQAGIHTGAFIANKLISEDNNFTAGFEVFHEVPFSTAAQLNRSFLNWLDDIGEEPFFAYIHYMEPHMPYAAPGQWLNRFGPAPENHSVPDTAYAQDGIRKLNTLLQALGTPSSPLDRMAEPEKKLLQEIVDLYDSEIVYWDERFRHLMEALKARGLFENTVVIITSDHGEEFLDHGMFRHGQHLHNELLHVPLIFLNAPHPSETRDDMVGLIDVAPTMLSLAKVSDSFRGNDDRPKDVAGIDLFTKHEGREFLFAETAHGLREIGIEKMHVERAAISKEWKSILKLDNHELVLFDRKNDFEEKQNLMANFPKQREQWLKLIDDWVKDCWSAAPYNISVFDASAFDRLKEMGYVK